MSRSCAVHRIIWLFSGLVLPVPNHFEWNRPSADQPTACAVDDHLSRNRAALAHVFDRIGITVGPVFPAPCRAQNFAQSAASR